MEILSEWYRDDDVTFLGKPGCGRMDQDVGMATGVRRFLRTSSSRINVRTAVINAIVESRVRQTT